MVTNISHGSFSSRAMPGMLRENFFFLGAASLAVASAILLVEAVATGLLPAILSTNLFPAPAVRVKVSAFRVPVRRRVGVPGVVARKGLVGLPLPVPALGLALSLARMGLPPKTNIC